MTFLSGLLVATKQCYITILELKLKELYIKIVMIN